MAAYGVKVQQQDGNLGVQPGSNTNTMLVMGCSLGGVVGQMYPFGDTVTAANTLIAGEGLEAVQYALKVAQGATILYVPLSPSTRGGVGAATKTGSGAMTVTPSLGPWGAITLTCVVGGTIGTAAFTVGVTNPFTGVTTTSAPITSAAGWTSTGLFVQNAYTNIVFQAGTYIAGGSADIYTISATGVVAHPQGAGPAVPTFTSSPIDFYNAKVTVLTGGAVGTSQVSVSLDGVQNYVAQLTTSATYAIPGTGIILAFSGTANATDSYAFQSAGPTFSNTDLTAGLTLIETTLLASQIESLVWVVGSVASAAAWATQAALLQAAAVTLANSNIFVDFFVGGPTVGTVLQNSGSVTIDSSDTDTVVIAARAGISASYVCVCAGDGFMTSPYSGLSFRRNTSWGAAVRAVAVAASQDIGAREDGGVSLFTSLARDDFAQGEGFWSAGITSLQTDGPGPIFINQGLQGTVSTSDFYSLTNSRVVNRASAIGAAQLKKYQLKKLPTQVRNGGANPGTVREDAAREIETNVKNALKAGMVDGQPQDAVAVSATTNRTNSLYATKKLIVAGAVQPFGYPTEIDFTVGMSLNAS